MGVVVRVQDLITRRPVGGWFTQAEAEAALQAAGVPHEWSGL